MMPYQSDLLRCHPAWSQLDDSTVKNSTRLTSCVYAQWRCCTCDTSFKKKINNIRTSTGRCRPCAMLLAHKTHFYTGDIPLQQHRIIRAGILQEMSEDSILTILRQEDEEFQYTEGTHRDWIRIIRCYKRHELLNNRYWDRKDVYWLSKRKRGDDDQSGELILNEEKKQKQNITSNILELSMWMRSGRWWIHWAFWAPLFRIIKQNKNEGDLLQYFDAEIRWRLFLPQRLQGRNLEALLPNINRMLTSFALLGLEQCLNAHFNTHWTDTERDIWDYRYISPICGCIRNNLTMVSALGSLLRKVDKVPQIID